MLNDKSQIKRRGRRFFTQRACFSAVADCTSGNDHMETTHQKGASLTTALTLVTDVESFGKFYKLSTTFIYLSIVNSITRSLSKLVLSLYPYKPWPHHSSPNNIMQGHNCQTKQTDAMECYYRKEFQ